MRSVKSAWQALLAAGLLVGQIAPLQAQHPGELERARKIVSGGCLLCHGIDGESSSELFPKLAAQNAAYIARQLANFKNGTRKSSAMQDMVKDLSDADMKALGVYFSQKPATAHDIRDPELAAVGRYVYHHGNRHSGVAACAGCHGPDAAGSAELPRLAGQNALYVENRIKQFNAPERSQDSPVMHAIVARMTELEIKAVAEYLAGKK
ncbi:MAG: c-type cytochrome [Burkholderiaceae bacterium]